MHSSPSVRRAVRCSCRQGRVRTALGVTSGSPPTPPVSASRIARIVAFTLAGLLVGASSAQADRAADPEVPHSHDASVEPDPLPRRENGVYWIFGFGTPVGITGVEAVHRLGSMEIAAGVGMGGAASLSEANAPLRHVLQWAVMPRFRIGGDDHLAVLVGEGLSGGEYGNGALELCEEPPCSFPTKYVVWLNSELAIEQWWSHLTMRYFLGLAAGCDVSDCVDGHRIIPYLGLGVGYAF